MSESRISRMDCVPVWASRKRKLILELCNNERRTRYVFGRYLEAQLR